MKAAFETPACNDHLPKSHRPSVNFHIAFLLQHTRLLDCRIKQVQVTQSHEQKASEQATNKLLYLYCFQNMSSFVPFLFHTLACAYADHSLTQTILLLHVFFSSRCLYSPKSYSYVHITCACIHKHIHRTEIKCRETSNPTKIHQNYFWKLSSKNTALSMQRNYHQQFTIPTRKTLICCQFN